MNIYNGFLQNKCLAPGDRLYSTNEVREMLLNSGLGDDRITDFYNSYHKDAEKKIDTLCRTFFYYSDDKWALGKNPSVQKIIRECEMFRMVFKYLILIQSAMLILFLVMAILYGIWPVFLLFAAFIGGSCFMAFLLYGIRADVYERKVDYDIACLELNYRNKLTTFIRNRTKVFHTIENTHRMYECMREYLGTKNL